MLDVNGNAAMISAIDWRKSSGVSVHRRGKRLQLRNRIYCWLGASPNRPSHLTETGGQLALRSPQCEFETDERCLLS